MKVPYDHRPFGMTREEYERRRKATYGPKPKAAKL